MLGSIAHGPRPLRRRSIGALATAVLLLATTVTAVVANAAGTAAADTSTPPTPEETGPAQGESGPETGEASSFDAESSLEQPHLRNQFSRTFLNADGSFTTRISALPMHFLGGDGSWEPIDTRVVPDAAPGTLRTAANRWTARFGPTTTGVRIEDELGVAVFVPVGAATVLPVVNDDGRSVTYRDVWPGVDLVYHVQVDAVKEEIVLRRRPDQTAFSFATEGLAYSIVEGVEGAGAGSLRPEGPLGDRWRVPPAEVLDKERRPVTPVPASIQPAATGLRVDIDPAYLDGLSESDYPIVVDPTMRTGSPESHSFRGSVDACWWCPIRVGNQDSSWQTWRGMAYFPYESLYGKYITYAQLDIWNLFAGTGSGQIMDVYHATAFDWPSLGQQLIDNAWGGYGYNMTSESLRSFYDWLVYNQAGGAFLKYLGEEGDPGWYTFKEFHSFELQLDWVDRAPVLSGSPWHSGNLYEDQTITVWQNWSHPTDSSRLFVCRNPGANAGGCTNGQWGSGGWTSPGSTAAASFVPGHNLGTQNFWTYVCTGAVCSGAGFGTFEVFNRPPNLTGAATDSPDPVNEGATITFGVPFSDYATGTSRAVICKTNAVSGGDCTSGQSWTTGGFGGSPAQASWSVPSGYAAGTYTYYAFACDQNNACSASSQGAFAVNKIPVVGTAADSPDPVVAGSAINFSVPFTDTAGQSVRAAVCKTNSASAGSCPGGAWAIGALGTANPATASYSTVQADVGAARNYWAFACDASNACSGSSAGSFTVTNATPAITSVSDSPDPAVAGAAVTFTVNYTDGGGDDDRAVICKTNAISAGACTGGTWATGSITAGGSATASYTTVQADVGAARSYWAFACDAANACSASMSGSFTVTNATPVNVSITDSPDPAVAGAAVTFTVNYTDGGGDADRAVICKTNAISAGACTGGTWATGSLTAGGTTTASYTTVQADVGAGRSYWAFACDAANACSASRSGSFTVTNATPAITSVSDSPDPAVAGGAVTFTVNYTDGGGDADRAVICKTNAISAGACTGGTWATGSITAGGTTTATYSTVQADVGAARNYWAFACDAANACSPSSTGTFTVTNATPAITSVSDSPDPAAAGGSVTFTINYTDGGGDADRAVICKTNAISAGACTGGAWATGSITAGGTATAAYSTVQADVGAARNYWAFACDAANTCSPSTTGTFTVTNAVPSIVSAIDGPDPLASGDTITFTVSYTDGGGDAARAVVCKTSAIAGGICSGGAWAAGSQSPGGTASATYTTGQADVGAARNYWAFACDATNACSSATAGAFTVTNVAPSATSLAESPDPVEAGSPITFTVDWSDTGDDTNRVVVCRTNSIAGSSCPGGTWTTGLLTSGGTSSAVYTTSHGDVGAPRSYWAFACDSADACSASIGGSFTVTNATPVVTSAVDGPDPVTAGSQISFAVTYQDGGGDIDRAVICRTNAISNSVCPGGLWTTSSPSAATATATYTTSQPDVGTNNYWAFACDSAGRCSTGVAGSFTVTNATPSVSAVSETPDPVASGDAIQFSVEYTDSGGDHDRALICRTNVLAGGTCADGTWANGDITEGGVATATYTTMQNDLGTQPYWAFACDSSDLCSSGVAGSFTVTNVSPTASEASATPVPAASGDIVTFSIGWSDTGNDTNRAVICRTDAITPEATCPGGMWTRGALSPTSPATATYVTKPEDVGPQLFWAFACDSEDSCTSSVPGSFAVLPAEAVRLLHEPVIVAERGAPVTVTALVTCFKPDCSVGLHHRSAADAGNLDPLLDGGSAFAQTPMASTVVVDLGDGTRVLQYAATIPAADTTGAGIDYYLHATDGFTDAWWPGTSNIGSHAGTSVLWQRIELIEAQLA